MREGVRRLSALALIGWCLGCRSSAPPERLTPDMVFFNGKIVVGNQRFDIVQAVAVREGKVAAIGANDEIRHLAGRGTQQIDLGGKTVLPGFYDNHAHIGAGGAEDRTVLDWRDIDSKAGLLAALKKRAGEVPKGTWIVAELKNENMPQAKLPVASEIDQVVPAHPVHLRRGHISIANSLAMKLAKVTKATPNPVGGGMERDASGEPTGWFREGAGHRMISKAIPPPPPLSVEAGTEGYRRSFANLLQYGITSVNVPGIRPDQLKYAQWAYQRYGEELPRATVQVRITPGYDDYDDPKEGIANGIKEIEGLSFHTGVGSDRFKLGAIKMSIDGGFSSAAYWTLEPRPNNPKDFGLIRIPYETFYPVAKRAHDLGWQLGIHAIGDGAVKMVVDAMDRILKENPRPNHRHYIHHLSVKPPEETLKKMAADGILASSQPNFTYSLGPYNAAPAVTPERLQTNNPQKSLRDHGIRVSFGSDGMPLGPLVGIYAAVTRKGVDGKVYGPQEAISIEEAIRSYTAASAYQTFDEDVKGTLEVGKYADMVVLSDDILTIDPNRIMDIKVEQTIVGGKLLYQSKAAPGSR